MLLCRPAVRPSPSGILEASALTHEQSNTSQMSPAAETVWRLPAGAELLWQTWDDEVIVFNTASSRTHLLDALSAATLKEIEDHPGSVDHLVDRLAERFELDGTDLSRRLTEVCARFDELGLVEPQRS